MWIKICGIKDVETARRIAAMGPDAIGLNFYGPSPRVVDIAVAAGIAGELPESVEPVGLFVNHTSDEILTISQTCGLRTIQLHGDEPPDFAAALPALNIIRAVRVGDDGLDEMSAELMQCRRLGTMPDYCLVDAHVPGQYGGTGQTVSWEMLAGEYRRDEWPPLILSGGLTPRNVAAAIRACRPWGVDVSSGVESTRGVKDLVLVQRFIEAARGEFERS
jgi:phosphoribosylanthranilate isomerase